MKTTTIQISEKTWKQLSSLKNIGESFDDVIQRLIATQTQRQHEVSQSQ